MYYQIKATRELLSGALDTSILSIVEPTAVEKSKDEDFFIIDITGDPNRHETSYLQKWTALKFSFAKRLLVLATSDNRFIRRKAVRQLAKIKKLESWQYSQLADMIDARTAVGLARTPDVDPRIFNNPPLRFLGHTHEMIVNVMKDLLINLHAMSQHPCMGYFISKAFRDLHV